MEFLLVGRIRPEVIANPPADLQAILVEEQGYAVDYRKAGHLKQAWSMAKEVGAVAIYEAADREDLDRILGRLPLARAGYADITITELLPYEDPPV